MIFMDYNIIYLKNMIFCCQKFKSGATNNSGGGGISQKISLSGKYPFKKTKVKGKNTIHN